MAVSDYRPTVSVIIPARAAGDSLPDALESIRNQSYRNIIEVIVAASDDESAKAAGSATVIDNPDRTTPAGLNRAIHAATGEVIVRCDAHAILPSDYVELAVESLGDTGAANVGGMQVPEGLTVWEQAIAEAMTSALGAGDARYRVGGEPGPVETVYLGVFKRAVLEEAGGYDEEFARNQDYELNHRLIEAGGVVWFDPRLKVHYRPRGSLQDLTHQYFEYGQAKRQFVRKHPGSLRWRQIAPPTLVASLAMSVIFFFLWPVLAFLPVGYVATMIAFVFIGGSNDPFRVAAALMTMHLGWGAGFISYRKRQT